MDEKILCPYCGPWNGHREGVEMQVYSGMQDGFQYCFWVCPICLSLSPHSYDRSKSMDEIIELTRSATMRRFTPMRKPQWISVKDRMPDNCSFVLAFIHGSPHDKDYTHTEVLGYDANEYQPEWDYVTHWMPLPEKPTDEERAAAEWEV